jgi:hypothetical protein
LVFAVARFQSAIIRVNPWLLLCSPSLLVLPDAQQKGPLAICASAGLSNPGVLLLSRPTGHSRQHALRMMMVMPAMLEREVHLLQRYLPPNLFVNATFRKPGSP